MENDDMFYELMDQLLSIYLYRDYSMMKEVGPASAERLSRAIIAVHIAAAVDIAKTLDKVDILKEMVNTSIEALDQTDPEIPENLN